MNNLEEVIKEVEKEFGKRTIITLSSEPEKIDTISTGILPLDRALNINGIPNGLIEIYSEAGVGKTSIALSMAAQIQKTGGKILFINSEQSLVKNYAMDLGVKFDNSFMIVDKICTEEVFDIIEKFIEKDAIEMVIIDSLAALSPRSEIDGNSGDVSMGLQARLVSQFCRRCMQHIIKTKLIIINQVRSKLNTFGFGGELTETTGGKALKFYSLIRLEIKRTGFLKKGDQKIGHRIKINIVKNKFAPPFQECEFDLIYGIGVSNEGFVLDEAINKNLINKAGAWFSINNEKFAQGRDNAVKYLKNNPEIFEELKKKVLDI